MRLNGIQRLIFVDPGIIVQFIQKNPTRCNNISNFYYSIFIWGSTCFGRHIAHHQKPKNALSASGFSYVKGCWTCSWWKLSSTASGFSYVKYCWTFSWWTLSGTAWQRPPTTRPTTFHLWKTRGCLCSFRLLIMGGVSPETRWSSYKYGIIKFYCCILLDFSLWIFKGFIPLLHVQSRSTLSCSFWAIFFICYYSPSNSG